MSKTDAEKSTAFNENSSQIAKLAMDLIDPDLSDKYSTLISFLTDNPTAASAIRGKTEIVIGSDDYITIQAESFFISTKPRAPKPPATIPDEMVGFIINRYFDVPEEELDRATELHSLSMGAENLIGDMLERYIASVVENYGWVWCAGSVVQAVDFIYRKEDGWAALQIKNRDNTENSSSSKIRKGTDIKKWFRTFSKKAGDNWAKFPNIVDVTLSEANFRNYVAEYLTNLKTSGE